MMSCLSLSTHKKQKLFRKNKKLKKFQLRLLQHRLTKNNLSPDRKLTLSNRKSLKRPKLKL